MDNRYKIENIDHDTALDSAAQGLFERWLASGRRLPFGVALLVMVATTLVLWVAVIHLIRLFWH